MQQTQQLMRTLKSSLRSRGLTYRDVAKHLNLSETSIKRIFAEQNISLHRLEQICQLLEMELLELVRQTENEQRRISELSLEQEREIVSDLKLLLVAFLVVNGWKFVEIEEYYQLPQADLIRYLVRLDRLNMIELLPDNRIRLLVSASFAWRKRGPIQEFFMLHLQQEFFKCHFTEAGEAFSFLTGMLSHHSNEIMVRKQEQLAREFHDLNQVDADLPIEKRFGYSMVLAIRPWRPNAFESLRRKQG